jgi:hypothetical protein
MIRRSEREVVMSPSTAQAKAPQNLKLAATLAATSGALHQTLLAVARAQGVNGGAWLDQLEAQFIRNTKNMTFTGCPMDAEAGAVEAALTNLKAIMTAVRAQAARAGQPKPHGNAASR